MLYSRLVKRLKQVSVLSVMHNYEFALKCHNIFESQTTFYSWNQYLAFKISENQLDFALEIHSYK